MAIFSKNKCLLWGTVIGGVVHLLLFLMMNEGAMACFDNYCPSWKFLPSIFLMGYFHVLESPLQIIGIAGMGVGFILGGCVIGALVGWIIGRSKK